MIKILFCIKGHDIRVVGRDKHHNCKACVKQRSDFWKTGHPHEMSTLKRNYQWKRYGIINKDNTPFTTLDYDRYYQVQKGKCLGCGLHQSELVKRLHADHDHITGIFRCLLCSNCNRTLGHAKDNPTILRTLADLLEKKEHDQSYD